ncbi:MAG: hypothetical protein KDF49_00080 [Nitrosomonas sp.]|nr:hypothetical protein [Nitrosomonas sp.]
MTHRAKAVFVAISYQSKTVYPEYNSINRFRIFELMPGLIQPPGKSDRIADSAVKNSKNRTPPGRRI